MDGKSSPPLILIRATVGQERDLQAGKNALPADNSGGSAILYDHY